MESLASYLSTHSGHFYLYHDSTFWQAGLGNKSDAGLHQFSRLGSHDSRRSTCRARKCLSKSISMYLLTKTTVAAHTKLGLTATLVRYSQFNGKRR